MSQPDFSKCQEWIKISGKRKVQSFQDCFADLFNISLGIVSLEGKSLTVWSNSSLFCHYILKKNHERCKREQQSILEHLLKKEESLIYTCYTGVTYFAIPIFCEKEIIAVCLGGGVYLEENIELANEKIVKGIQVLSESKLNEIVKMLENIFNLINIEQNIYSFNEEKKADNHNDLMLLNKKLSLRELEVVKLINSGMSNKEIASDLNISEKTVKTHITNILRKLKMKDRLEIVISCKNSAVS
ncbi:PocR ligand-binding domain-containing protein [Clostridium swellfunianum]|uniref:LuxR family transcriptional regulator n=1 Tax=Clostridium swellfunianum TaxID=1367462 RepID=UPI002030BFEF|nr:LuxR family transcriptional regulator [Clostridium swellfunianum]MCM0647513.1 PocR ligand-binding domain-containing protein [Clostridium swellfunianum]